MHSLIIGLLNHSSQHALEREVLPIDIGLVLGRSIGAKPQLVTPASVPKRLRVNRNRLILLLRETLPFHFGRQHILIGWLLLFGRHVRIDGGEAFPFA